MGQSGHPPTPDARRRLPHRLSIAAGFVALTLAGCTDSGGFHIQPEHQDLGVITSDDRTAVASFQIINGLSTPVHIRHIFPSCTCTQVRLKTNPIPPGTTTTLEAILEASQSTGRQTYVITLETDSPDFPRKRLTMDALAPARGLRQRHLSLGTFTPGATLNREVPILSVSSGCLERITSDETPADLHVALDPDQKTLRVTGTAPAMPGVFQQTVHFRESIPEDTSGSTGEIELSLTGTVVPRWSVPPEYYLGFFRLSPDDHRITLSIPSNPASQAIPDRSARRITARSDQDWLSVAGLARGEAIELQATIHGRFIHDTGPLRARVELELESGDGQVERTSTTIYARFDRP